MRRIKLRGLPPNRWATALLPCCLILFASGSYARVGGEYTKAELATLPKWCHSTQSFTQESQTRRTYDDYVARYGQGWTHLHHYCWALVAMMRYDRINNTAQDRRGYAASALADMRYVLDRTQPDFVLWFEIVSKRTRLLIRERIFDQALESANSALAAFPNRADSHGLKAEVLLETGRRGEAKKVLDDAKTVVADSDRLEKIRLVLKL